MLKFSSVSIPFIAGQWSLPARRTAGGQGERKVSIPFIAGQWSLPPSSVSGSMIYSGFNPLHCGAVVASCFHPPAQLRGVGVSIPFIAGQWSLLSPEEQE